MGSIVIVIVLFEVVFDFFVDFIEESIFMVVFLKFDGFYIVFDFVDWFGYVVVYVLNCISVGNEI